MLRQRAQLLLSRTLSVALPAQTQTSSSYHAVSTMSTSESSSSSFWNTTTALIAVTFATTVVATSDYVSPNKITDCCGIIDVIGTNFKEYNNYNGDNCTEKGAFSSSVVADTAIATTISASYSSSHRGTATSVTFNNNNSGRNETSRNFIEHSPPPQQQARSLPGIANDASPRIVDVVFGNIHPNHPGNVVYERLINSFRQRYIISRDALVKETISESIVRAIQGKGGRFLEFIISDQSMTNSSEGFIDGRPGGKWYAIGDSEAFSRTARDLSNRNNNPNLFATASAFDQQPYPLSSTTSTSTLSSSSTLSSALTLPPPEQAAAPVTRLTNNRVAAFHLDDSSNGSGSGSSNGSGTHRASATTERSKSIDVAPTYAADMSYEELNQLAEQRKSAVGASAFAPPIKSPPQQLVHRQPHHQQPHQPRQACPPQQQVQQPLQIKPHVPLQYHPAAAAASVQQSYHPPQQYHHTPATPPAHVPSSYIQEQQRLEQQHLYNRHHPAVVPVPQSYHPPYQYHHTPAPAPAHVQQSYHPPQHYHPTPTPAAAPVQSSYIQEQQRLEQQQLYDRHHPTPAPVHPPQQHQHYNPYTGSQQVLTPTQSYHHPPVFQPSTRHVARMSYSPNQGQQLEYSVSQQVTQQYQQQFAAPPSATNNNWGNFTESVSDVLPDQIVSSTSEAMSDEIEFLLDSNISNSTMNVPTTTTTHKRKGKRKGRYDFIGGEYVAPSDDCQDYSKSHRLVYEKGHPAKRLKSDGEAMDIEKFIEGRGVLHATCAANLWDGPFANLAPHIFGNLDGGIFANGLKPLVQADKKSKKPMEAVWVMPYGRGTSSIAHIVNTHGPALKESGGWVALIMIPADDDRIKNFTPFRSGSNFSKKCHPAYSYGEIPVSPKDVLIVNINDLPVFLKETKVRTDLIPLKTDDEKKATRVLSNAKWYHNEGGKEKRAKASAKWYHNGGGKESAAARYAASTNRPVKRHTHTRGARCTDATLGPDGVLQCRFDTIAHSHSKKKGDNPTCALHKWAGTRKTSGIVHCETCNVHLCTDCFTTFHTHFDLVPRRFPSCNSVQ